MEYSKEFGDGEDCYSSTESGWTMYLCSPENSDESDIYDDEYTSKSRKYEAENESDDSMASDASSGPRRLVQAWGNGETGNAMFINKARVEEKNGDKGFYSKRAKYQKQEKKKDVYAGKEAEVSGRFNGKVTKNSWFGKRK